MQRLYRSIHIGLIENFEQQRSTDIVFLQKIAQKII